MAADIRGIPDAIEKPALGGFGVGEGFECREGLGCDHE